MFEKLKEKNRQKAEERTPIAGTKTSTLGNVGKRITC